MVVWLLFGFMAINFMDKTVLGIAGDELQKDLGIDDVQFGLISSTFFLAFTISGLVVGWFADRFPPRTLLLVLVLAWSVAQLIVAVPGTGLTTLILTRILLGVAEGPAFALANHTVFTWFRDHERTVPSSVVTMGAPAGVAIGAPLLALMVTHVGWRSVFLATGLIGLLWLMFWVRGGAAGPYAVQSDPSPASETRVSWRALLLRPTVAATVVAGFAAYWTMAVAITWLPLYLQRARGWDLTQASAVAASTQLVGVAVIFGVGLASQRLHARGTSSRIARGLVIAVALAISALGVLAVPRVSAGIALVVAMLVAFTVSNSVFSLIQATLAEIAPLHQRSAVLGTVTALAAAGGAFGPVIVGTVVDAAASDAEGFSRAFDLGGVLLLVGALAAAFLIDPAADRRALDRTRPIALSPTTERTNSR